MLKAQAERGWGGEGGKLLVGLTKSVSEDICPPSTPISGGMSAPFGAFLTCVYLTLRRAWRSVQIRVRALWEEGHTWVEVTPCPVADWPLAGPG